MLLRLKSNAFAHQLACFYKQMSMLLQVVLYLIEN